MAAHSEFSSNREKLLEHLFIGEVLKHLWCRGVTTAEFLRPEVDSGGYDLVIACNRIIRHVQLKASHSLAKTARQNVHLRLADQPSGCVVWMKFDETTLALGPFLWFGGAPGERLPVVEDYQIGRHTRRNLQGIRLERQNIRVLPAAAFSPVASIPELVGLLFGPIGTPNA
ncbi:MAG: hypothetical protein SH850_24135 [Planctomycetaceae bacterium]|nr:hypothetical protein [Planctomycetaceae bacterium]